MYLRKFLISAIFVNFVFISLNADVHVQSTILIESIEDFNALPTISTDAYEYLKSAQKSHQISRFIFVRHGESTANKDRIMSGRIDVDLTEKGVEQAQSVGSRLYEKHISFDAVYSSPSLRAQRTATLILNQLADNKTLCLDERLYEKFYGPYEGAGEKEYAPVVKKEEMENSGPGKSFEEKFAYKAHPEMESLADVYARVTEFLKEAHPNHRGQNVLVGTHGGVMKALFMADAAQKGLVVDNRSYELGNCAVVIVEIKDDYIEVKATDGLKFRTK